MTQEELLLSLELLDIANDCSEEHPKDILTLINRHVAEVIGEDEALDYSGTARNMEQLKMGVASFAKVLGKNELRSEQRKRAGLNE